jgi:hypothetical protein
MKRLLAFCFLLSALCLPAAASTVWMDLGNATLAGLTNRRVVWTPPGVTSADGRVIVGDTISFLLTNSVFISNVVAGVYSVEVQGPPRSSRFSLSVFDTNGVINAADILVASTNSPGAGEVAYSTLVSDARYLRGTTPASPLAVPATVVTPPDGIAPPWTIYRTANGYASGVDLTTLDGDRDVTMYVDHLNGAEENDGLTWATAKEKVAHVISATYGQSKRIYLSAGTHSMPTGATFTNHVSLISTGGVVTLGVVRVMNYADAFVSGVDFDGGIGWITAAASNRFTCVDSRFYNSASNGVNVRVNAGQIYMLRCDSFTNALDGFNYHLDTSASSAVVLEENCAGFGSNVGASNNGSSAHDNVSIVRLNGSYWGNYAYNVIDIDNGWSWNLGVSAGASYGDNDVAFAAGLSGDTMRMVLEDCTRLGQSTLAYIFGTGPTIEIRRPTAPVYGSTGTGTGDGGNTNLSLSQTITKVGYLAADAGQYGATLGSEAGRYAGETLGMVALSPYAFLYATNATYGIAIGYASAQYNEDGRQSLNLGVISARFARDNYYSLNAGYGAGQMATNNNRSINLGPWSGTNANNRLWIETQASEFGGVTHPLIYGEFDRRFLRFGANVTVMSNFTAAGSGTFNSIGAYTASIPLVTGTNFRGASIEGGPHHDFTLGSTQTTNIVVAASNAAFTGTITGNASGLTNISATNIAGTFPIDSPVLGNALESYVAPVAEGGAFIVLSDERFLQCTLDGSVLTNLNASALASGTVSPARMATNSASDGKMLFATSATSAKWDTAPAGGPAALTNAETRNVVLLGSTNFLGTNVGIGTASAGTLTATSVAGNGGLLTNLNGTAVTGVVATATSAVNSTNFFGTLTAAQVTNALPATLTNSTTGNATTATSATSSANSTNLYGIHYAKIKALFSTNYTATAGEVLFCSGTNQIITLPNATNSATVGGTMVTIIAASSTASVIVTNANGVQTILGGLSQTVPATNRLTVITDSLNWW